ncbi:MAG: YdcF family protein [Cytophagaceae bacterium]|nr:YdcF family protein [Cytophagaceae bacterium]
MVWITVLLVVALFTRNQKRKKRCILISLLMVLFFGNEFIVNEFLLLWEKDPVAIQKLEPHELGIVLTGVTNTEVSVKDRVYFTKGADRVLHTVQLYKSGKVKKILISGGSGLVLGEKIREADQLKNVFLYCGIPEKDLIIENASRNTWENALFSKRVLDNVRIKTTPLLITSAFHMRRSEACFIKAGMNVDIFPVDIYTRDRKFAPDKLFIPSESAFSKWALLIHECLGFVVYKMVGYA